MNKEVNICQCANPIKEYSESGCYLCWVCKRCGKFGGCDNQILKPIKKETNNEGVRIV